MSFLEKLRCEAEILKTIGSRVENDLAGLLPEFKGKFILSNEKKIGRISQTEFYLNGSAEISTHVIEFSYVVCKSSNSGNIEVVNFEITNVTMK